MQSLSNFSRDEGVNGARVEIVIRNARGTRGTGSPTLTLFELLPTGFLLWRRRPFVPSFFLNVPVRAPRRRRGRTGTF